MNIIPAIFPKDFEDKVEKLSHIVGLAKIIQVDVCDGEFGKVASWMPRGTELLSPMFSYEFDVMVTDWRTYIPRLISMGADRIVAHVDTFNEQDLLDLLTIAKKHKIMLGLTTSNDVAIDHLLEIVHFIEKSDLSFIESNTTLIKTNPLNIFVQVMSVAESGLADQVFDERALNRIRILRKFFPTIRIQVDGGIDMITAQKVKQAGADTLVVDTYLGLDYPKKALEALQVELDKEFVEEVKVVAEEVVPPVIIPEEIVVVPEKVFAKDKIVSSKQSTEALVFSDSDTI